MPSYFTFKAKVNGRRVTVWAEDEGLRSGSAIAVDDKTGKDVELTRKQQDKFNKKIEEMALSAYCDKIDYYTDMAKDGL